MPFRLGAAAAMASILATLVLMIVKAVVAPPDNSDIVGREAFLLQHVLVGLGGGLVLQLIFHRLGAPGYRGGLAWGLGGFLAVVLIPWMILPLEVPGVVPRDAIGLLVWLFTVACAGGGLFLLRPGQSPGGSLAGGRLAGGGLRSLGRSALVLGIGLLLLPLLVVSTLPEWTALPVEAGDPLAGLNAGLSFEPAATDTALGMEMGLGLDLVFWLLLGFFSVLATRRVVLRQG
ncbi:CbtA family protein [Ferrovibrio sp.]|uniref:CbtA family protein n=1 Tax=Ferrovibrio sp. TaxID=1917215 RepID=UPI002614C1BC|nr:CbtA family protein [Ferrovibrio sp.]